MVHICEAFVHYDHGDSQSPSVADTVDFCLSALEQTRRSYPIAGPLQQMFRSSVKERGISIPHELELRIASPTQHSTDELLDACIRPTYKLPVAQIALNMEPDLGQKFMETWNELTAEGQGGSPNGKHKGARQMSIEDMLNR